VRILFDAYYYLVVVVLALGKYRRIKIPTKRQLFAEVIEEPTASESRLYSRAVAGRAKKSRRNERRKNRN
jgi:hypothetical protein